MAQVEYSSWSDGKLDINLVTCTQDHLIFVHGFGYVQASDLKEGDALMVAGEGNATVLQVTLLPQEDTVYNILPNEFHNYFVGEVPILVSECEYSMQGLSAPFHLLEQSVPSKGTSSPWLVHRGTGYSTALSKEVTPLELASTGPYSKPVGELGSHGLVLLISGQQPKLQLINPRSPVDSVVEVLLGQDSSALCEHFVDKTYCTTPYDAVVVGNRIAVTYYRLDVVDVFSMINGHLELQQRVALPATSDELAYHHAKVATSSDDSAVIVTRSQYIWKAASPFERNSTWLTGGEVSEIDLDYGVRRAVPLFLPRLSPVAVVSMQNDRVYAVWDADQAQSLVLLESNPSHQMVLPIESRVASVLVLGLSHILAVQAEGDHLWLLHVHNGSLSMVGAYQLLPDGIVKVSAHASLVLSTRRQLTLVNPVQTSSTTVLFGEPKLGLVTEVSLTDAGDLVIKNQVQIQGATQHAPWWAWPIQDSTGQLKPVVVSNLSTSMFGLSMLLTLTSGLATLHLAQAARREL
jgi:hypothetical protein